MNAAKVVFGITFDKRQKGRDFVAKQESKKKLERDAIDASAALLPRHAFTHRSHKVAKTISMVLVSVLAFGATGVAVAYSRIMGGLEVASNEKVNNLMGKESSDPKDLNAGHALNILVLGSDVRSEEAQAAGEKVAGMRSDTTLLVHVSADRSHVEVVSIPRDTMVTVPECVVGENADGSQKMSKPKQRAMFNSAFQDGAAQTDDPIYGAACTMKTVEANTNIPVDYFVVVDFDGFAAMIDAVQGVELCIPTKINDKMTGTKLDVGWKTLQGDEALGYVRARHGVSGSDGSDINRMSRQQKFVSALMRKVLSAEVLANPAKLVPFLISVTQSLTASENIANATSLAGLAIALKDIDTNNVRFLTAPFEAYPKDKARVQFSKKADELWTLLLEDKPLNGFDPNAAATDEGTDSPAAPADTSPPQTSAPATGGKTPEAPATDAQPGATAPTTDPFDSTSGEVDPDDEICGPRPS